MIAAREFLGTFLVHCIQLTHLESQQQLLNAGDNKLSPFDHATPLTPDRPQVKRPSPSLQITSNFLVFYGLLHGTTLEKISVAQNVVYSKI